jgi:DNA-binding MurR/RpiR family transcriptional regulator
MNSQTFFESVQDYSSYGISTALNSVFHESERALSVITPRDLGYIVDEIKAADVVLTCSDGKGDVLSQCCTARLQALGLPCQTLKSGATVQRGEQALLVAWFGAEPNDSVLNTILNLKRRGARIVTFLTNVDTPCARASDHVVLISSGRPDNRTSRPLWRESSFERASLIALDAMMLVLSETAVSNSAQRNESFIEAESSLDLERVLAATAGQR